MAQERYLAGLAEFLDPQESPPPLGVKVLLLTGDGTCVIGAWAPAGYIGWHPLPKIPKHLKEKL